MPYASLAVRHRPRRFADVAGQRHACAVLADAARRHTPPQQILLSGGSGLGKTTLARLFAAALFCTDQHDDGDACGVCESCLLVASGSHPDVIEMDAASHGGVGEIRSLAESVPLVPLLARWKVYIIDEAHGLSGAGAQAALKMVEEPPAHVVFVLATTEPEKLSVALRGRCTWLEVLPPSETDMAQNLQRVAYAENWELGDDVADAIIAATDPALGMRGTLMTLEKIAGRLSDHATLSDDDMEDLLGSVSPARLAALTEAITSGSRRVALLALSRATRTAGAGRLRGQLLSWARRELLQAARDGDGFDDAWRRFETLATAGTYPGALEVAVGRMSAPAAPAAELARAEPTQSGRNNRTDPPPAPAAGQPAPVAAHQPGGAAPPESAAAVAAGTVTNTAAASPLSAGVPVPLTDPGFVSLLNSVGSANPGAAAVLRRCVVTRSGAGLSVDIPAALTARANATGLAAALAGRDDVAIIGA